VSARGGRWRRSSGGSHRCCVFARRTADPRRARPGKTKEAEVKRVEKELANIRSKFSATKKLVRDNGFVRR
jgi:hypothetical protein